MHQEGDLGERLVPALGLGAGKVEVVHVGDGHLDVVRIRFKDGVGDIVGDHRAAGLALGDAGPFLAAAVIDLRVLLALVGDLVEELVRGTAKYFVYSLLEASVPPTLSQAPVMPFRQWQIMLA